MAIGYSMHEVGRTRKHQHPFYPLHHSCHTPEHLTQTLTCRSLNGDAAYILHYIYSHLTQGQQKQGPIAVTPRVQESHRHQYGNGKVDIHAVQQCTTPLPALQMPDVDRNYTHLQHLTPEATTPSDPELGIR